MFWSYLSCKCWNNELSYEKRKLLKSKLKLYIPIIKTIKKENLQKELKIWNKIVFEEAEKNILISKVWLDKYLCFEDKNTKFVIFDNHNVALYFIWKNFLYKNDKLDLIHIDQHSDLRVPNFIPNKIESEKQLIDYVFKWTNVWNYLLPAQKLFVWKIFQVRTENKLFSLTSSFVKWKILNIDLDFWSENMFTSENSLFFLKKILYNAKIVLIATSPYFIKQKRAIDLINKLFI